MTGQWFYIHDGQRQGPIPQEELEQILRDGRLGGADLVWSAGLTGWVPAEQVPALAGAVGRGGESSQSNWVMPVTPGDADASTAQAPAPAPAPVPAEPLAYRSPQVTPVMATERALDLLRQTRPWARIVAIMLFVLAGLCLLIGCVGGIAAIASTRSSHALVVLIYLPFAALYLAPALYVHRYASRISALLFGRREHDLEAALEAQKSFWKFTGIMIIVMLGLAVLTFLIGMLGALV
jgi:hypothetical protein